MIGGVFYFLLVVSVMPRCSSMAALLDADSVADAVRAAVGGYFDALAVSACLLRSEGRLGGGGNAGRRLCSRRGPRGGGRLL